jgi:hypothetical protein
MLLLKLNVDSDCFSSSKNPGFAFSEGFSSSTTGASFHLMDGSFLVVCAISLLRATCDLGSVYFRRLFVKQS